MHNVGNPGPSRGPTTTSYLADWGRNTTAPSATWRVNRSPLKGCLETSILVREFNADYESHGNLFAESRAEDMSLEWYRNQCDTQHPQMNAITTNERKKKHRFLALCPSPIASPATLCRSKKQVSANKGPQARPGSSGLDKRADRAIINGRANAYYAPPHARGFSSSIRRPPGNESSWRIVWPEISSGLLKD
ncbi:hypothetical protein ALC53_12473 [Atta colombica]|uniref:Uncharacterized protein n=1 Tax=Atta colombica TaxID=520822 RepID=A0A195AY54_9HYME|nr:hypothetical protein ALC53_12473 [Atta colombica]